MKQYLITLLFAAVAASSAHTAGAQMIIASTNLKASEISKSDLKDIFSGDASTLGGIHVTPVLLKGGAVNDEFLSAYIGKSDLAFRTGWRSLVFSGQATMPRSFDSEAAVVEYVAHNPGTIGYIGRGTPHEEVKVIAIK
jgi:ABC-type phosphate transport system substrate-binding protein